MFVNLYKGTTTATEAITHVDTSYCAKLVSVGPQIINVVVNTDSNAVAQSDETYSTTDSLVVPVLTTDDKEFFVRIFLDKAVIFNDSNAAVKAAGFDSRTA